jgi:hypothetical protein
MLVETVLSCPRWSSPPRPDDGQGHRDLDRRVTVAPVQRNWTYFFGYLPGAPEQAVR